MDDLVITEQTLDELVLNYEISTSEEELLRKELFGGNRSDNTESLSGGIKHDASSTQLRSNNRGYDRVCL